MKSFYKITILAFAVLNLPISAQKIINLEGVNDLNFVNKNGNIGIGTNTPRSILNIKTNNSNGAIISIEKHTSNQIIGGLRFGSGYDNFNAWSGIEAHATGGLDQQDLRFYTTYGIRAERMRINQHGNVGIGTNNPGAWRLAVNGKVRAKEIKVETGWADFVFYEDYKLPTLTEVENHIKANGHLKDIPSAKEVAKNGIFLGEMNAKLLQKIEELTLYTIAQEKKLTSQAKKIELLEKQQNEINELKALVKQLANTKK